MLLGKFERFASRVKAILEQKAHRKGYSVREDQGKELFEFVGEHFGGHPLGEIVYKCVRYRYGGDARDLEKIAAWAYLVWQEAETERSVRTAMGEMMREAGPAGAPIMVPVPGAPPGTPAHVMAPLFHRGNTIDPEPPHDPPDQPWEKENAHRVGLGYPNEDDERADLIHSMTNTVRAEAHDDSKSRPRVWEADPVRLAALVAEESGEATKEALNATRTWEAEGDSSYVPIRLAHLRDELIQTAAMAIVAATIIKSREE